MIHLDSNLFEYEIIYQTDMLVKSYYWYRDIGYNYLKQRNIDFPVLKWYKYFSHPNDNWLLIGGFIKDKKLHWIFYIPDLDLPLTYWRYLDVSETFSSYFSKVYDSYKLPEVTPKDAYGYEKIEQDMFPNNL